VKGCPWSCDALFEHGTEEIALETALVDLRIRPSLVLRAGILLPPIGYLNQNHDSPPWDWVDRPLVTAEVISTTLSEVGGGAYGKVGVGGSVLSWDLYLTNGLGNGVVGNDMGRTHIPAGKREDVAVDAGGKPGGSGDSRRRYRKSMQALTIHRKRITLSMSGMSREVKDYLSRIGRKGGQKSRRALDPETARRMVAVREARRAFRRFHTACFWSYRKDLVIGAEDVPWVAEQLMKHGDREAWRVAQKLCP